MSTNQKFRMSSCKISYANLKALQNPGITKIDILLYLYLATIQDARGICKRINVQYIVRDILKSDRSSYYKSLSRLRKFGLIAAPKTLKKSNRNNDIYDYRQITIQNNVFENEVDDKRLYFNVNHPTLRKIFSSPEFRQAKTGTIKLFLYLIVESLGRTTRLHVKRLKAICNVKLTGVLNSYLAELQHLIAYEYSNNRYKFIVFPLARISSEESNNKMFLIHHLRWYCKRFNIIFNLDKINDICNIIINLTDRYGKKGYYYAMKAVTTCISRTGDLIPAYINKVAYAAFEVNFNFKEFVRLTN